MSTECDASIDYDDCDDDDDDDSWDARDLRCVDASSPAGVRDGWWWIETGGVSRWTGVGDG